MINLLDLTLDELKAELKNIKEAPFRAKQIMDWMGKGTTSFDEMHNLGPGLIEKLKEHFVIDIPVLRKMFKSMDGTRKGLYQLADQQLIEAVLMHYEHGYSVCISTQVGCSMGCSFCASTKGGKVRDLTAGEMIGQILAMQKEAGERISNVVLMGSGEPFDNFKEVARFLEIVTAPYSLNIGQRHITVSTCGVVPGIRQFADLNNQVTLALSLHQVSDEERAKLMPITRKYPLSEVFDALHYYQDKTHRRISFEYALVAGNNDSKDHARAIKKLLTGLKSHVNLIPLNEIKNGIHTKPDGKKIRAFQDELERLGIETSLRQEKGADIEAACGQLKRSFLDEEGVQG